MAAAFPGVKFKRSMNPHGPTARQPTKALGKQAPATRTGSDAGVKFVCPLGVVFLTTL